MSTIAYLAGFLDGEGTFTVYRSGNVYSALISAASTDKAQILWLQQTFSGNIYSPTSEGNRVQSYQWQLRDKRTLIELIPQLIPYLRIKQLQAKLLLKYCQEYLDHPRGRMVTEEEHAVRGAYCVLLSDLNAVGRGADQRKAQVVELFASGEVSLP